MRTANKKAPAKATRGAPMSNGAKGTNARAIVAAAKAAAPAAVKRAEELLSLIERRKARIAEDFFEIGQALLELQKKKLYVALGYPSFAAMLSGRDVMSVRTAEKLIEIAESVPRRRALELGAEKAYALSRLVAATPELDSIDSVLESGIQIGKKKQPVAGLSSRQIEETARAVRKTSGKRDAREVEASKAARTLQAAARSAGARGALAVASRGKGGFQVELRVATEHVEALVRALR
ncbi:MAG: hypothetical protein HYV09_29540 [Deltaproteobacteria bacterium]|nr:hypothetical protein [Deltaproteobacteria bacterium]